MKIALAQAHLPLGDFNQNCRQILDILKKTGNQADLLVFPEGGLWGYPPKDFLYQDLYFKIQDKKFQIINKSLKENLGLILPAFVKKPNNSIQNGAFLFEKGKKALFFPKEFLPNQGVFFESRYFAPGQTEKNVFHWKNKKIQILICEDLWRADLKGSADLFIVVNASPYTDKKQKNRLKKMRELTKKQKAPAVYLNLVGAQDSLIFDGGSFALSQKGERIWQGAFFEPDFKILDISKPAPAKKIKAFLNLQEQREQALLLGIKEFFAQTGFSKAILGLSGGMDSALTAYLAAQALGSANITAYFLPGPYTQKISYKIAHQISQRLKIQLIEKDISSTVASFTKWLFNKKASSLTCQNVQARLRALILMAFANESSSLLLATGNKSEIATGYTTIYGDLAGALGPIGDLLKSQVYDLASFINKKAKVFPQALFLREPSAELAPKQKDQVELAPYKQLDPILERIFKDQKLHREEKKWLNLVQKQEFKRAQAPPILKLSERDMGESWRKPLAHKFTV